MLKHLSVLFCTTTTAFCLLSACGSDSDGPAGGGDSGVNTGNAGGDGDGDGVGDDGGSQGAAGNGNGNGSNTDDDAGNDPDAGDDAGGGNPGTGGPVAAIPLSDADFDTAMLDDEEALQKLVGEYDVAIYKAPEDHLANIGRGTIDIAYDGDIIHLTLKGTDGHAVAEVQNSRQMPVNYGQATFTQVLGMILVDDRDSDVQSQRIEVSLAPDGFISGYVGGSGEFYQFRNNVIHYGPTPPPHLLTQEGTWVGPQLALTCDQPPITVEIAADGSATISGTANLDCEPGEVQNQWDGQDDYVGLRSGSPGVVDIFIDSAGYEKAIRLTVDEDPEVVGVLGAKAVLEGFRGNLESESLEKQ